MGGFGDPARGNRYTVRGEDLLDARSKLGASYEEIVAMLDKAGFHEPRENCRSLHCGRDDKGESGASIQIR